MSKRSEFYLSSTDGRTNLHAVKWEPEGEIKAILQISHGMVEFIERYDEFARYLNSRGFLVVGHDHLGHGKSIFSKEDYGYFAEKHPNETVIADIYEVTKKIKAENEGVPYFLLGHSMGSFYARQYFAEHGEELDGIIIMGTGGQPAILARTGLALTFIMAKMKGWHYRSKLIDNMAFGGYNKRFEPARTSKDWLTKDETIVDTYISDERCQFIFTLNGYRSIFTALIKLSKKSYLERMPKSLPVLLISGKEDPVGNFGKSILKLEKRYQRLGIEAVTCRLYETDRHEILNELDRDTVYEEIGDWLLDKVVKEGCICLTSE